MIRETETQLITNLYSMSDTAFVDQTLINEFKTFARIDNNSENASLESILKATILSCEKWLGRAIITQNFRHTRNVIGKEVELPYPPLQSITAVYSRNDDGTLTAVDSSTYYVVKERIPGAIMFTTIPTSESDVDPFVIDFVAGYGDNYSDMPDSIKQAILVWANDNYQNRVVQPEPPVEVKSLLSLYMVERMY